MSGCRGMLEGNKSKVGRGTRKRPTRSADFLGETPKEEWNVAVRKADAAVAFEPVSEDDDGVVKVRHRGWTLQAKG